MLVFLILALIFQFKTVVSSGPISETSHCDYRYCKKGETCTYSNISSPIDCNCRPGYSGVNCTDQDECSVGEKDPCRHRGVCVNTIGSYTCNCLSSWSGTHCEDRIQNETECLPGYSGHRCELALCKHGYALNSSDTANFTCHCDRGWSHTHSDDPCDEDINECKVYPNICKNGGNCSNINGSYVCDCIHLWDGENCTTYNSCLANPCRNNGTCLKTGGDNDTTYDCHCQFGYGGINCTEDIDECSMNITVCLNGNCTNTHGSYNCNCETGWTGKNCNLTLLTNSTSQTKMPQTFMTNKSKSTIQPETTTTTGQTNRVTTESPNSRVHESTTQGSGDSNHSLTQTKDGTPIIVGAGVGGVVIVIIVCIVGRCLYKRKRGRVGTVNIAGDADKNEKFNIERISKTENDFDGTESNTVTQN